MPLYEYQCESCGHRFEVIQKFSDDLVSVCPNCGKGPVVGRHHSHANNVSPRRFEPNLQTVRALINGGIRRIRVCTRCLRSQKVVKAA